MDKCSFCGREKKDVNLLIAGMEGHICDRCIEQAYAIVEEEFKTDTEFDLTGIQLLKPKDRITSYNVCYTKLLRAVTNVTFHPSD